MNNELCVPTRAVSLAGESGETVAPEVGDAVSLTVEGKIARVEGERAYVSPETANGEPVETSGPPESPPEETEDSLMAEARSQGGPNALQ